jgi:prolyl-tRNA synthetase
MLKLIHINTALEYIKFIVSKSETSGLYTILPIGIQISNIITNIIRKHQDKIGCEISIPSIINKDVFKLSGRSAEFYDEIFLLQDNDLCLQPTSEEAALMYLVNHQISYKLLPKYYYQISKKFRKEIRPRNSIIRCLEFIMKDGYSFDIDKNSAYKSYNLVKESYIDIFKELGIEIHISDADNKSMLSQYSEEFIFPDNDVVEVSKPIKGIEMAHIFYIGDIYSRKLNIQYINNQNSLKHIHMCSFGIGIYRVMYAYIKNFLNKSLQLNLYLYDVCIIYRNKNDILYNQVNMLSNHVRIIDFDMLNMLHKDKINIIKKTPVKLVVYEENQKIVLYNQFTELETTINKNNIEFILNTIENCIN